MDLMSSKRCRAEASRLPAFLCDAALYYRSEASRAESRASALRLQCPRSSRQTLKALFEALSVGIL